LTHYLDASAAAKLLVEEPESQALAGYLDSVSADDPIVSSALLETELRRLAVREGVSQAAVTEVIERVDLVEPNRSVFHEAGVLPGRGLRTLDALHIATAVRMGAATVVGYDVRLLEAAGSVGLRTASPS
jgi:predicted nucleic acid-binding protein